MTGHGLSKYLSKNIPDCKVSAFIDSDPSLHGSAINGIEVKAPQTLPSIKEKLSNILIIVAVSLKEEEISTQLIDLGFDATDFIMYSDYVTEFYTIDVVGTCNLRCSSCAWGDVEIKSNVPRGTMDFDSFTSVLDKAEKESGILSHVSLYSWGEPLLHPRISDMIDEIHERGAAVAISSNLSIRSDEAIKRIAKSAPEYIKISLSGFFQDVYEKTHNGGDIKHVKSNMYRLRYYLSRYKSKSHVDVNYHMYKDNSGTNLSKMEDLCDELGFGLSKTYALIMPLERVMDHLDGKPSQETKNLYPNLLVNIEEGIEASKTVKLDECPFLSNQVNINWDLSVPLCCTVFNRNEKTVITKDYISTSLSEINRLKSCSSLCGKCMSLHLPQYNMGYNRPSWDRVASSKVISD